nr:f-box/lrr-repeat protein 7 [Quercus suber]
MRRQQFRASQTAIRSPTALADPLTLVHSYDASVNPTKPARSSPLGSSTIAGLPLELLERLKAFPLFQAAPESFLLSIGRSLRPSVYQPAQEIIREGEDAKAMYWVVRGSVRVTSRDGESTYAELRPGSVFGEIGILMDMPRTASIVASVRSLVVRLNKEDLQKHLPIYPAVERAIREEALERLAILERKKKERQGISESEQGNPHRPLAPRKRSRDGIIGDVEMAEAGSLADGEILANKKRKSPSPGVADISFGSAMSHPPLTVRRLLKELPLFSGLPSEILHFLGVNAQAVTFLPFTDIIKQGTTGRDVYFIIKGDVEVLTESTAARKYLSVSSLSTNHDGQTRQRVRARLHAGQYFGEVTSLSLAPVRTATVRSVQSVECLLISGLVIDHLWQRCGDDLRQQVESEAKRRLKDAHGDDDIVMADATTDEGPAGISTAPAVDEEDENDEWRKALPDVKFDVKLHAELPTPAPQMEPIDPDPYFNADLINMRAKSRRSSLAPSLPSSEGQKSTKDPQRVPSPPIIRLLPTSPLSSRPSTTSISSSPARLSPTTPRRPSLIRLPSITGRGRLPDPVLAIIFQHLELLELMRCRLVSNHWWNLLNTSPDILHHLDLSIYNTHVGDDNLKNVIVPFVGDRPRHVNLSNCFHITDDGFKALADACGLNVRIWKMKSVWDVSGPAVLALVDKAKSLEELDLSNCRKVGDNLLARVIGWVVPEKPVIPQQAPPLQALPQNGRRPTSKRGSSASQFQRQPSDQPQPPPGTVIGASSLKRLTLSYCKHVQDRSMAHIAVHAAARLVSLDLTRCTSISDAGFHAWSSHDFANLRKLVLADCTYLSDQAIVGVVGGCRGLLELDLSFCCALSDTATEVLALGLPALRSLNMAFCGSAVSDNSMQRMGLHLLELRYLSVRGCVRVTGQGVESVVEGCRHLDEFDVSQCKNLRGWLDGGGVPRVLAPVPGMALGRSIRFDTVADGSWRVGPR